MKQQITPSPAPVLPWLLQESLRIFYYSFPIVCNVHTTKTCFLLFVPRMLQSTVMGDTGLRVCMLYHIRKGSATNGLMSQQVIFLFATGLEILC